MTKADSYARRLAGAGEVSRELDGTEAIELEIRAFEVRRAKKGDRRHRRVYYGEFQGSDGTPYHWTYRRRSHGTAWLTSEPM